MHRNRCRNLLISVRDHIVSAKIIGENNITNHRYSSWLAGQALKRMGASSCRLDFGRSLGPSREETASIREKSAGSFLEQQTTGNSFNE